MIKNKQMLKRIIIIIPLFISLVIFANAFFASSTKFLGLNYNEPRNFSCCKKGQLILHHYYSVYFLWIKIGEGYTDEKINVKNSNDCKIICID